MKHALPLSVCVPLFLFSFALPGGELRFAVPEKTKLAKVFDDKIRFHSTGIRMRVDGEDVDSPMSSVKVQLVDEVHFELSDVYGALKDGKPATLERTFDKLEGKATQHFELPEGAAQQGPPDMEHERSSGLEGKTVRFTLGEDGEYKAAFAGDKADEELLEKLEEDMDLRRLLPTGAVEVDKSWEIDIHAFYAVLNVPGGRLKLKSKDEPDDNGALGEQLEEHAKGKAKGTYKGQREVDGHKYAVVALEAEATSEGRRDESEKAPAAGATEMQIEYSVEGELLWDSEAGHIRSCKLESKIKMTMKSSRTIEHNGESHAIERISEFEGEGEFTCKTGD
jgi:hypothetical protein